MIKSKHSQSEIVGFVMIIIIVAILAVFFLGYYIRKPSQSLESKEIANFLTSMLKYTTPCAISYEPNYLDMGGLMKQCYRSESQMCLSGENVCDELNSIIKEIIEENWDNYAMEMYYEEKSYKNLILSLKQGNCTNFVGAREYINEGSGNIVISLDICSK